MRLVSQHNALSSGCVWAVNMASHLERARRPRCESLEICGTECLLTPSKPLYPSFPSRITLISPWQQYPQ